MSGYYMASDVTTLRDTVVDTFYQGFSYWVDARLDDFSRVVDRFAQLVAEYTGKAKGPPNILAMELQRSTRVLADDPIPQGRYVTPEALQRSGHARHIRHKCPLRNFCKTV